MKNKPPIPSPFSAPELEPETLSFKMLALPMFLVICTVAAVIGAVLFVPMLPVLMKHPEGLLQSVGGGILTGALYSLLVAHTVRVIVSPEGIRGHSFWGKPAKLQWHRIISAQKANFLGLKYLKLSSSTRQNVIWLPLFLCDLPGFVKAVAKFAHPDNPLHQQLAQIFANKAR